MKTYLTSESFTPSDLRGPGERIRAKCLDKEEEQAHKGSASARRNTQNTAEAEDGRIQFLKWAESKQRKMGMYLQRGSGVRGRTQAV